MLKLRRMDRMEFIAWSMVQGIIVFGVVLLITTVSEENTNLALIGILGMGAVGVFFNFYLIICRLFDIGASPWWSVVVVVGYSIPYVFWVPMLVMMLVPGDAQENKYGNAPA